MKLYREHYQPNRVGLQAVGGLNAVATRSDDGRTLVLKVVNAYDAPSRCRIRIEGFQPVSARQWVVAADPLERNTMLHPHRIAPVESTVEGVAEEFVHAYPAYSVTVLEFRSR